MSNDEYSTAVGESLTTELDRRHAETPGKVDVVELVEDHMLAVTYLLASAVLNGQDKDELLVIGEAMLEAMLDMHIERATGVAAGQKETLQ